MGNVVIVCVRTLFSLLDRLEVVLMNLSYSLLTLLSSTNLVDTAVIKAFGQRLGLILGIFMLFSIAVQLINYLISPDKVSDKSKGGVKLITNICISIVMLVFVNLIFSTAYKIQYKILEEQIIPKFIFGVKQDQSSLNDNSEVSFYLYSTMVTVNENFSSNCSQVYAKGIDSSCEDDLIAALGENDYNSFSDAIQNKDASKLFNVFNLTRIKNGEFVFDYMFLFSNVIGIVVLLILLGFCLDVAKRCITLYFYQLIAPLPIIANMIPGKGQDIFKKWYKACVSTYLDLFIRLIALFFAVYLITIVWQNLGDIFSSHKLIGIFIILGALMFAKELPQIIQNITGIKLGGLTLNPLKKIDGAIPAAAGGFFGAGLAGAKGFGANFYSTRKDKGILGALGSGISGGTSAFGRGLVGAAKGQNFKDTSTKAYADSMKARLNRQDRNKYEITTSEVMKNKLQRAAYAQTNSEREDAEVKAYDEFVSAGESLVSISESEVQKYANKIELSNFGGAVTTSRGPLNTLGQLREAMSDVNYTAQERADINQAYEKLKGDIEAKYREYASLGGAVELSKSKEFKEIISSDDVNGETAKVHADNMLDIYKKNQSKEGFRDIEAKAIEKKKSTDDYILGDTKQVTKATRYASTRVKSSGQYRHDHAVQEQTNKEAKK